MSDFGLDFDALDGGDPPEGFAGVLKGMLPQDGLGVDVSTRCVCLL